MGWLTHPPQFTFTKTGTPICRFRLGCSNLSSTGEPLFFTCLALGGTKQYNLIKDYNYSTGDTVFISGAFQYRGIKKAQNGKPYPELSILVQSINGISTQTLLKSEEELNYTPEIMVNQETKFNNKRESDTEDLDLWGKSE